MHSICRLIFAFAVIAISNGETSEPVPEPDQVTEIYEFWKKQEQLFHLGEQKEVVLILGNTRSGKSSTALLLTDAKLYATAAVTRPSETPVSPDSTVESADFTISGEDEDDDGAIPVDTAQPVAPVKQNLLLNDVNHKIGNETINSHTLIPELFTDETGVAYYDCPGFEDTRQAKFELTIAFFLQKLMNHVDSFKLLFVVPEMSVQQGGDPTDFRKLAANAAKLIKNIGNYSDAIGMVVTKVQPGSKDSDVIQNVVSFLTEAKHEIATDNNEPGLDDERRRINSDSIDFINALLVLKRGFNTRTNTYFNKYTKIGIYQKPDQPGEINQNPIFQRERRNLRTMINDHLKYVHKVDNTFGYVISQNSRSYIKDLTKKIVDDGFGTDVANVDGEIREFYQKLESRTPDISELHQKFELGADLFSAIRATDPRPFMTEILNATYGLEMALSMNTIDPILKHIESVDFLLTVANQTLTNPHTYKITDIVNYLRNSQHWYKFLMFLEDELTNIGFQNDDMKATVRGIVAKLQSFRTGSKDVLKSILQPLFDKFANSEVPYEDSISKIDMSNLKALKNVLNEYLSDEFKPNCSSDPEYMEIKGRVIKMSDVVKHSCFAAAKNIKIFALTKLIVDESVNKTGKQAQMVVIAPTWDIVGRVTFNLNGDNGINPPMPYAANGTGSPGHEDDGKKGEPGKPGSAGGNFFAIGLKFVNGDSLTIQVNGGNGGAGQHGGNGSLKIDGRDPPVSETDCPGLTIQKQWDGFRFERTSVSLNRQSEEYTVEGIEATKAGNGGDGGKQGDPGMAGKIVLFELGQAAHLKTYKENGTPGAAGKGGRSGGGATKNGRTYKISTTDPTVYKPGSIIFEKLDCVTTYTTIDNGGHAAGTDGNDNANDLNWEPAAPPLPFNHPLYAVNEYKNFAREQSVGSIRRTEINTFLDEMTNNGTLKAQYGTLDLIDEFTKIENQYFKMRGKIDFIPYLESLLSRTDEWATANNGKPEFIEQKKALAHLYTAILSKINNIQSKVYKNTVIDMDGFLKQLKNNIDTLKDTIAKNNMNIVRDDFNAQINEKIQSANEFIKSEITPAIDGIFDDVDKAIDNLIKESIAKQDATNAGIDAKYEAKRKLEANLRLRWLLAPIKVVATAANAFGPYGMAVGAALNTGTNVIESLALSDVSSNTDIVSTVSTAFKSSMSTLGDVLKAKPTLLQQKIDDIDKYIKKNLPDASEAPKTEPKPVYDDEIKTLKTVVETSRKEINSLNDELTKRIANKDFSIPKDLIKQCAEVETKLEAATKEVKEKLESKKANLGDEKKAEIAKYEKPLEYLKYVQNVMSIVDVSIKTYKEIQGDEAKVAACSAAIAGLKGDLKVLRDQEEKIHSILIPQIGNLHGNINELEKNLAGKSHVELDVKKWNIRSTLNDIRLLFNKMTKDFGAVQDNLKLSIDKLDEGLATLINVYDRIDSYSDSAKLTAYIKNIVAQDAISDPELSDNVLKLKRVIQSNTVLEAYELAMHAFKQHYFPITDTFTAEFGLPANLQMTEPQAILEEAKDKITSIINKIELDKTVYNPYGHYIQPMYGFDGSPLSQPPFYAWKYREYKDQIKELLQGNAITLKADVTRGVNQNAIKFNRIGVRFKFSNGTTHSALTNLLHNEFRLNMSIVGTNYYRCKNRYYQIPLDQSIDFKVRFENDVDDEPKNPDKTYQMITSHPAFLSPYTMWTMKLIDGDKHKLQPFANQALDMELIGKGYYIEHGTFADEICNDQLDKYYNFDETISNVNALLVNKLL